MAVTKGVKQLVAEAEAVVKTYTVDDVKGFADRDDVVLVDIRDVRELYKLGKIEGATHAPRGMLEFWVDPESPYYRETLGDETKEYVLYCGSGWRSALAAHALHNMGLTNYAHMGAGFSAWSKAEGAIEPVKAKG